MTQIVEFPVPIYPCHVTLVLADPGIPAALRSKRLAKLFGPVDVGEVAGLSLSRGPEFALLFRKDVLEPTTVAHEVFHATLSISDWCGLSLEQGYTEGAAHLHGWLFNEVFTRLRAWGCKL